MKKFVSLALSATMLPDGGFTKKTLTDAQAADWLAEAGQDLISGCNPTHKSTLDVLAARGFNVPIPATAPKLLLGQGDELLIFQVVGLPRLNEGEVHTAETVQNAKFVWHLISVE